MPEQPKPEGPTERVIDGVDGRRIAPGCAIAFAGAALLLATAVHRHGGAGGKAALWVIGVLLGVAGLQLLRGLTRVASGEAVVVQSFGRYVGTLRVPGLRWIAPWTTRRRVSTKIRSHETSGLKVNDAEGNPVQISAVVVWRVADTARAVFETDDYVRFVATQCDAALREVTAAYRYDTPGESGPALSGRATEITDRLTAEVAAGVGAAGIEVVEARIISVSYAPEIAHAMLRRQQAGAIVAARQQVVEGAVGMVQLALHRLDEEHVVDLDEERKAAMVSNLLVVLCSDHATQPIVNAGSLYH